MVILLILSLFLNLIFFICNAALKEEIKITEESRLIWKNAFEQKIKEKLE